MNNQQLEAHIKDFTAVCNDDHVAEAGYEYCYGFIGFLEKHVHIHKNKGFLKHKTTEPLESEFIKKECQEVKTKSGDTIYNIYEHNPPKNKKMLVGNYVCIDGTYLVVTCNPC